MVTNVDARENAQANYDHAMIKYKCHDIDETTGRVATPPSLSIMAQTHKKSTAARFLRDYLGMVLYSQINKTLNIIYNNFNIIDENITYNTVTGMAVQSHDFILDEKYKTVVVSVTNSQFPAIPDLTPEERQQRAEKDELSTKELPLFILDNVPPMKKVEEWNRKKTTPNSNYAVKRDDIRTEVSFYHN